MMIAFMSLLVSFSVIGDNVMSVHIENRKIKEQSGEASIYGRMRALLKTQDLPPNTRLLASQLSAKLGHCGELNVRNALLRLARENVVIEIPYKGYFTKGFSSSEICTLYEANSTLLDRSLELLQNHPDLKETLLFPRIYGVGHDAAELKDLSPRKLVQITYDLFMHIVKQSGQVELIQTAISINEKLKYIRLCEYALIRFPEEELGYLCHLYRRKHIKELRRAVKEYHNSRFRVIPSLMEIL